MSKWTNVRKFDLSKGKYTNSYYKLSDFDYFVDSEFGSDTNDGLTPSTAFKTLSKITTLGTGIYVDGLMVACAGHFVEGFQPNKMIKLIGVGGNNGRCLYEWEGVFSCSASNFATFLNFEISGAFHLTNAPGAAGVFVNCILHSDVMTGYFVSTFTIYNTVLIGLANQINQGNGTIFAYNSTIFAHSFPSQITYQGKNIHVAYTSDSSHPYNTNATSNSINATDSRYFTDNTETTPADLYIDSANGNYGIVSTFDTPIWDKQTQQYITANPLYHTGADGANIGAGVETLALTALDDSLKSTDDGGDAAYVNMDNDTNGSSIFRIDDTIDGTLTSGVQDLGRVMNGVKIDAIATYDTNGGLITKRLQQSTPSIEQTTDFGIQFGETQQECEDMTPILCEYGKVITYSKSGNIMYGNSDLNFQPNKKNVAKFRYFIISIRAKTIS